VPKVTPENKRRGRRKNSNPAGDLKKGVTMWCKDSRGTFCRYPAMRNGRCRLHGGLSPGPKTAESIERIRRAVTKHGNYSNRAKEERAEYRGLPMALSSDAGVAQARLVIYALLQIPSYVLFRH
jgi:hypothetical protein